MELLFIGRDRMQVLCELEQVALDNCPHLKNYLFSKKEENYAVTSLVERLPD